MNQKTTVQLESLYAQQVSRWVETMRSPRPGDEARFVAWLKESPRNVRDFLLMLSVDHALGDLDAGRRGNIESLLASVDQRVAPLSVRTGARAAARASRRWRPAALAASILVAAAGGWAWFAEHRASFQQFETATGEQRTFELEDGSVVYLNTHSRVAIRLAASEREVRLLRGEALFRVHHDPGRPFRVYTDDAMVQAVGTQFDVYRRDDGTVVAVLEGRVDVTPAVTPSPSVSLGDPRPKGGSSAPSVTRASSRSLGASQEARVNHAGSVSIREVNNVSDSVAWRERRLIFRDQTLGQIVSEFNRYRANPIRLEGSGVAERIYTGVFDADDADSLVQVLARDPALTVDHTGEGIVVRMR
jgi:transmembrane sensor